MALDVKPAFLVCDEGQAECAIPHVPLRALTAAELPLSPRGLPLGGSHEAHEVASAAQGPTPWVGGGTGVAPSVSTAGTLLTAQRAPRVPGQARWVGPPGPERPVMEILFLCLEGGRRYYSVRLNGQEIFVGTRLECDRFLALHDQKVAEEQAEARRTPRARPFPIRSYRATTA